MAYTKLFQSIVTSSIWTEDDKTRIVWITMLALADRHGEIQASIPGLARVSGVSIADTEIAIAKFLAPDSYSRTTDDEGRRIEKIEGGWALLNHAKYREMASDDDRKTKAAVRQKRFRDKESRNSNATVTQSNATVTHESRQIPQAEAEAKADTESKEKPKIGGQTFIPEGHSPPKDIPMAVKDQGTNSDGELFPLPPIVKKNKARCTVEELKAFAVENGLPESDGEFLFFSLETRGWKDVNCWKSQLRKYKSAGDWLPSMRAKNQFIKPQPKPAYSGPVV